MNKRIEFVLYNEAKDGAKQSSLRYFRDSYNSTGQRITGLDYYVQDSEQRTFTVLPNTWLESNLLLGIGAGNSIGGAKRFWKYICRLKDNSGSTDFIGYVKWDNIRIDPITRVTTITAIDVWGYLLDIANKYKKIFTTDLHNYMTFMDDLLKLIRDEVADDMDFNITSNYTLTGFPLVNFHIKYGKTEKDGEEINLDSLFTGTGGGWYGAGSDPPNEECNGGVRWRHVEFSGGNIIVYMVDYSYEIKEYQTHLYLFESMKVLKLETNRNFIINNIDVYVIEENQIYYHEELPMYETYYHDLGYPESDNDVIDDSYGNKFILSDSRLLFTGDMIIDTLNFREDEEETGEIERYYKIFLDLFILNNLALLISKEGDITLISKTDYTQGETQVISNNRLPRRDNQFPLKFGIIYNIPNFESKLSVLMNYKNMADGISYFFDDLFEKLRDEHILRVENVFPLSIYQELTLSYEGENVRIVSIKKDINEVYYDILAWNKVE